MVNPSGDELLVAVGDDGGAAAVGWAAGHAVRAGVGLCLVHVAGHARHMFPGRSHDTTTRDDAQLVGRQLVEAAAARVDELTDGAVPVRTEVRTGGVVAALADLGSTCGSVVLSHRPHGAASVFRDSVALDVAARVDVPVVSVPQGWRSEPASDDGGLALRVSVGVADPAGAEPLITRAVERFRGHDWVLSLLHAWHVSAARELGLQPQDFAAEGMEREARRLSELASAWQSTTPDVDVESRLLHGRAVSVLQEVSQDSDHLVVGRSHRRPSGHVGSVTAALLRHAACPVEVVPVGTPAPG